MKKAKTLEIRKVTLRDLDDASLQGVAGGTNFSTPEPWCTYSVNADSGGCPSGNTYNSSCFDPTMCQTGC